MTITNLENNFTQIFGEGYRPSVPRYIMDKVKLLLVLFILNSGLALGQALHKDIHDIYNFEPHKLSGKEQECKAKLMDAFWEKVKKDTSTYLDLLRIELRDTTNPSFFFYDGGKLLLSLSNSHADYEIILNAMKRSNLKDIDASDFVKTMYFFAFADLNTTDNVLKTVDGDNYFNFIVQHKKFLGQDVALSLMLLPLNSGMYLSKAIGKLEESQDSISKIAILGLLFYSCTCQGDSIILKYSKDTNQNETVRKYSSILAQANDVKRIENPANYSHLISYRKALLRKVNNNTVEKVIEELGKVTMSIKGEYKCP